MTLLNELYSVNQAPVMVDIGNLVLMKDLLLKSEHAYIVYKKWGDKYFKVSYLELTKITPGELLDSLLLIKESEMEQLLRNNQWPYFLPEEAIGYLLDGYQCLKVNIEDQRL